MRFTIQSKVDEKNATNFDVDVVNAFFTPDEWWIILNYRKVINNETSSFDEITHDFNFSVPDNIYKNGRVYLFGINQDDFQKLLNHGAIKLHLESSTKTIAENFETPPVCCIEDSGGLEHWKNRQLHHNEMNINVTKSAKKCSTAWSLTDSGKKVLGVLGLFALGAVAVVAVGYARDKFSSTTNNIPAP